MLEKIIKFSKQLYSVKYSTNLKKCVETAIDNEIGNNALSQHFQALGITKQDYVAFIISKINNGNGERLYE